MNRYIKYALVAALPIAALTSCNDYLDTMPDNRATLDSENKIKSILVSAYIDSECAWVNELSSDNCDDYGEQNPNTNRWMDDTFAWKDESESVNESLDRYWEASYIAIAGANEALAAIENLGGPSVSPMMAELKGEALMCRAYIHFMLANLFCHPWTQDAEQYLGLPYMEHPETQLKPRYERGNLADFYNLIQKDLEEGLQLVGDSYYDVPKYHFTRKAAYAFATRFYLYTEQWEKAVKAGTECVGTDPSSMLRNWSIFAGIPGTGQVKPNAYISPNENANLLLQTSYSRIGVVFGGYTNYSRYSHGQYLAINEDFRANNIYGSTPYSVYATYTGSNFDKSVISKCSYLFEYTDPVAGVGYTHTVIPVLTADEAVLNRAEAHVMLGEFDEAAADLSAWMSAFTSSKVTVTPQSVVSFYKNKNYCYSDNDQIASGLKKHLNPAFEIDEEGSTQECMLQCVLAMRRIETLHHGLRWYDIRRYGIEIPRRVINASNRPDHKTDWLGKDDPRRTYQIPLKVRDAGFQPNPR
ncbi:MAG: RagB/SusD family nutrient uptake outer membrane protein [Muribaculaceae bacterium]|nr:RagB/SusD family nutrient uptake outer membrane protein [Muribaculaceae bacterium]